jgi:hypothetical protein
MLFLLSFQRVLFVLEIIFVTCQKNASVDQETGNSIACLYQCSITRSGNKMLCWGNKGFTKKVEFWDLNNS